MHVKSKRNIKNDQNNAVAKSQQKKETENTESAALSPTHNSLQYQSSRFKHTANADNILSNIQPARFVRHKTLLFMPVLGRRNRASITLLLKVPKRRSLRRFSRGFLTLFACHKEDPGPPGVLLRSISQRLKEVWRSAKNRFLQARGLRFNEDPPEEARENPQRAWPKIQEAGEEGKAVFVGSRGFINGSEVHP